jgi:uncharacterized membrane protein
MRAEQGDGYRGPLVTAGILLGVGLGGFVDGIVLHQILQWHHMLTVPYPATSVENLELNTVWDGIFHAFTWVAVTVGLTLLWRAGRRPDVRWSGRVFVGSLAIGWGLFNLIEGIVDHHILGIHHVRPGPNELVWDIGFLAFGAILVGLGWAMVQAGQREATFADRR